MGKMNTQKNVSTYNLVTKWKGDPVVALKPDSSVEFSQSGKEEQTQNGNISMQPGGQLKRRDGNDVECVIYRVSPTV